MKAFSSVTSLFSVLAVLSSAAATSNVRGVDPAVADRYVPSSGKTFTCLSGDKVIPFSAVNDNYCDCPDGSDEPGTSACEGKPAAWFYCENKGHIPGRVRSSRVNDGICDPECCDGSDEWQTGVCPNNCEQISREYRERVELETKTRRTGAKIRSTYVNFALKEKKRLEDLLTTKRAEIAERERKVEEARQALERAESQSRDELERKKATPLYQSVEKHRKALAAVQTQQERMYADLQTVLDLLEELSKGYNPNGQDMAVKHAVIRYKELIGRADAEAEEGSQEKLNLYRTDLEVTMDEGEITRLQQTDLESLLISDDGDSEDDDGGLLYRLEEYIPDSLYDYYDTAREAVVSWLTTAGIIKAAQTHHSNSDGPHVAAAREQFHAAERELNNLRNDISSSEGTLGKLSDGSFGPQGEWKKLDGTCIDTVAGDYTYELCFFGKATQKSNKDHSSNHLGSFTSWNGSAEPNSPEYYRQQKYQNGARCWNGPMRSVTFDMTCGTVNAITSVTEPEKCEYLFRGTTPALCLPLEAGAPASASQVAAAGSKDEL
ncbi:hypothetical protein VHUM_02131 [Vanrija humicola]|uniref:Glucosidase 2 subunit beta n=1 Tax=Vanrija humicola TaxID=5417 RepID=A0A7D8V1R4_VANHU|nr:hypothetical protein VHUM_02131 [Vanrija humicola]